MYTYIIIIIILLSGANYRRLIAPIVRSLECMIRLIKSYIERAPVLSRRVCPDRLVPSREPTVTFLRSFMHNNRALLNPYYYHVYVYGRERSSPIQCVPHAREYNNIHTRILERAYSPATFHETSAGGGGCGWRALVLRCTGTIAASTYVLK